MSNTPQRSEEIAWAYKSRLDYYKRKARRHDYSSACAVSSTLTAIVLFLLFPLHVPVCLGIGIVVGWLPGFLLLRRRFKKQDQQLP